MKAEDLDRILALSSVDPALATLLDTCGIASRPAVTVDEAIPEGPVVATQAWLRNARIGIEFGFDDEAAWRGWNKFEYGRHPMLLTQICLYGGRHGVRPYPGELPFGLLWSDDRATARARLASASARLRAGRTDAWQFETHVLVLGYGDDDARLDFIVATLNEPPWPPLPYDLAPPPDLASLMSLLGRALPPDAMAAAFAERGLDLGDGPVVRKRTCDFRLTAGFDAHVVTSGQELVMDYFALYRQRESDARGWTGALPFDLHFDDAPDEAIARIGVPPAVRKETDKTGYAVWHLDGYGLHIAFSTIVNVLLRVRVMAPGVWETFVGALDVKTS